MLDRRALALVPGQLVVQTHAQQELFGHPRHEERGQMVPHDLAFFLNITAKKLAIGENFYF
jgi:hypothetical protein